MIDQEHRGTGTEEQIKSLSQVSVGGGRTLGAAQTGKKAPPLAQSHTNPLPSVSLPPLPTYYYQGDDDDGVACQCFIIIYYC